jgi:hypothetical protein
VCVCREGGVGARVYARLLIYCALIIQFSYYVQVYLVNVCIPLELPHFLRQPTSYKLFSRITFHDIVFPLRSFHMRI